MHEIPCWEATIGRVGLNLNRQWLGEDNVSPCWCGTTRPSGERTFKSYGRIVGFIIETAVAEFSF